MFPVQTVHSDVVITDAVFTKLASTAALEVPGVAGMAAQPTDMKAWLQKATGTFQGVKVFRRDGEIRLDLFLSVELGVKVTEVAAAVQKRVKKTVQDMTGCAVSRVNVMIADVAVPQEQKSSAQ